MNPFPRPSFLLILTALASGAGCVSLSAALTERSPFLPPGFVAPEDRSPATPPPAATQGPLSRRFEFRGVYELEGEYRFLITDKRTREGKWVPLDDSSAAFHVRSFDLDKNAIVLNHEGQTESIELERLGANTTPMPVAGAPSPSTRPTVAATQSGDGQPPTRTRRPTVRPSGSGNTPAPPPPPQWLQERREAAARAGGSGRSADNSPFERTAKYPNSRPAHYDAATTTARYTPARSAPKLSGLIPFEFSWTPRFLFELASATTCTA